MNCSGITKKIALTALIAALYAVLTVVLAPFSYSWFQIRMSECLTPLPYLLGFPAVLGLALGCIISNFFSPIGIVDIIFGPLFTFIAGCLSWKASRNNKLLACVYPVIVNGLGVSSYLSLFYGLPYLFTVATVSLGEFIACIILGYPLLIKLEKIPLVKEFADGK